MDAFLYIAKLGSSWTLLYPGFALLAVTLLSGAGCSTILAVNEQQAVLHQRAIIAGNVTTAGRNPRGPLIVGLLKKNGDRYDLIDHFVAVSPGSWIMAVEPGTYWVAAFEDSNANGRYENEPALRVEATPPVTLNASEQATGIELVIPAAGRFDRNQFSLSELEAHGQAEQPTISLYALSVTGTVASLEDPRFAREVASSGIWKSYDFLKNVQPGIYFLETYDPHRVPVLFVHGMGGTPREFEPLIAALDPTRFQAWVAYYPSGVDLKALAIWLDQLFVRLRAAYGFKGAAVVAHSMGGLVAREFVLRQQELNATTVIRTYVTISSPLGGMESAGEGVRNSPVVVNSWRGLAPGSAFLDGLFYRKVPSNNVRRVLSTQTAYHLLFGFRNGGRSDSGDGTVVLASQLRPEAQQEARTIRGFDEDHVSILSSPAVSTYLNEVLSEMR